MIACTSLPNNRIRLQIYVKTYAQSIEFWNGPLGQGLFFRDRSEFSARGNEGWEGGDVRYHILRNLTHFAEKSSKHFMDSLHTSKLEKRYALSRSNAEIVVSLRDSEERLNISAIILFADLFHPSTSVQMPVGTQSPLKSCNTILYKVRHVKFTITNYFKLV